MVREESGEGKAIARNEKSHPLNEGRRPPEDGNQHETSMSEVRRVHASPEDIFE